MQRDSLKTLSDSEYRLFQRNLQPEVKSMCVCVHLICTMYTPVLVGEDDLAWCTRNIMVSQLTEYGRGRGTCS